MIDVDDQDSWPAAVHDWAGRRAEIHAGADCHTGDLGGVELIEAEPEFRALLEGEKLVAYHFTRLLDHEIDSVRRDGLRVLQARDPGARLKLAYKHGHLDEGESDVLARSHFFALREDGAASDYARVQCEAREGRVCLVVGRRVMEEDPRAFEDLVSTWGGEVLYRAGVPDYLEGRLLAMGRPTVVVAGVPIGRSPTDPYTAPGLAQLFIGALVRTPGCWADVHARAAIPPGDVIEVRQPGHADYDRFPTLPG